MFRVLRRRAPECNADNRTASLVRDGDGSVADDIASGYKPSIHPAMAVANPKHPLCGYLSRISVGMHYMAMAIRRHRQPRRGFLSRQDSQGQQSYPEESACSHRFIAATPVQP